ncbi:MAG: hypothetical protein Q4P23_08830, partial [Micrococcaceae bacterium]|nr:hypothetical protein [Micrococcaceae bacterium]
IGTQYANAMVLALAAIDHVLLSGLAAVGSIRAARDRWNEPLRDHREVGFLSIIHTHLDGQRFPQEDVTNHPASTLTTWFRDDASVR